MSNFSFLSYNEETDPVEKAQKTAKAVEAVRNELTERGIFAYVMNADSLPEAEQRLANREVDATIDDIVARYMPEDEGAKARLVSSIFKQFEASKIKESAADPACTSCQGTGVLQDAEHCTCTAPVYTDSGMKNAAKDDDMPMKDGKPAFLDDEDSDDESDDDEDSDDDDDDDDDDKKKRKSDDDEDNDEDESDEDEDSDDSSKTAGVKPRRLMDKVVDNVLPASMQLEYYMKQKEKNQVDQIDAGTREMIVDQKLDRAKQKVLGPATAATQFVGPYELQDDEDQAAAAEAKLTDQEKQQRYWDSLRKTKPSINPDFRDPHSLKPKVENNVKKFQPQSWISEGSTHLAEDDEDSSKDTRYTDGPFAICPTCRGRGEHVNPAVDSHGLTSDDFAEDPEFAESYFRGVYNIRCSECDGRRVIPQCSDPDCDSPAENIRGLGYGDRRETVSQQHYKTCYEHLTEDEKEQLTREEENAAAQAYERRMGA